MGSRRIVLERGVLRVSAGLARSAPCRLRVGSLIACRSCRHPAVVWLSRGMRRLEVRLPIADFFYPRPGRPGMITIGIDPHKSTLTAVGLAPAGPVLSSV